MQTTPQYQPTYAFQTCLCSEKQELPYKCLSDLINYWVTSSVEQRVDDTAYKRVYALYGAARRTGLTMESLRAVVAASTLPRLGYV